MKKIVLISAVLLLLCTTAYAKPTAGTMRSETGIGFAVGNGTAFNWEVGGDYSILEFISVGGFVDIFAGNAFAMDVGVRATYTLVQPFIPDEWEPFASFGVGYQYTEGGFSDAMFPLDLGFYYFPYQVLDGRMGFGSRMGFNFTTLTGRTFYWSWLVASIAYQW